MNCYLFVWNPKRWSWDNIEESIEQVNLTGKEVLLNPEKEPILELDVLKKGNLSIQTWTPQASGISIRPELIDELEATWFNFLTTQKIRHNPFIPTTNKTKEVYTEGTPNQIFITKYERNPFARKKCIDHHGYSCAICGFNFEKIYGTAGKKFIHVHHLAQIAKRGKSYDIDPINDLLPVCPNCHSIVHRRNPAYTPGEIKALLAKKIRP
jgi:5-methylcytosine-specific restriction enzyme A